MFKKLIEPTNLVFLIVALAVVAFTFYGKFDAKDFGMLAVMVFSHYFKSEDQQNQSQALQG